MSGPGGGGGEWRPRPKPAPKPKGDGDADGDDGPPDPCNIVETTTLNSPNRTVLAGLRAGDQLDVVYQSGPPQQLLAQHPSGTVAGSITSPSMLQIIQCITQGGIRYVADVISVRGAICQVQVRPA